MSSRLLHTDSTLTNRYQTTIPNIVRKSLGLEKQDKIHYTIQADGNVLISRANQIENDPALDKFLKFLTADINQNPQNINALNSNILNRVQSLVSDVEIDLESQLNDEDE